MAPRPSPVIVSSTNVLIASSERPDHSLHHRLVGEELLRGAGVDDASGVEHDGVARDPRDDSEVLLDEQDRRQLRHALEHARDLGDEQR